LAYLLLCSTSLQPLFAITILFVLLLFGIQNSELKKKMAIGFGIALVLFIPHVMEIILKSYSGEQFHNSAHTLHTNLIELLKLKTLEPLLKCMAATKYILFSVGIFVLIAWKHLIKNSYFKFALVYFILFFILIVVGFKIFIDYPFFNHYAVVNTVHF